MIKPGYYAVFKDIHLRQEQHTARIRKLDWLVTDGQHVGRFDREAALDWVPLQWSGSSHLVALDEELSLQLANAAVQTTFTALESRFAQFLDTGDGLPAPDLPKPSLGAGLGTYLTSRRNLLAGEFTYERR
jgi:hypothetical protein